MDKTSYIKEDRRFILNATPRQKKLWRLEKKYSNKAKYRRQYMAVVEKLMNCLPPSKKIQRKRKLELCD